MKKQQEMSCILQSPNLSKSTLFFFLIIYVLTSVVDDVQNNSGGFVNESGFGYESVLNGLDDDEPINNLSDEDEDDCDDNPELLMQLESMQEAF